jgi:Fructose-bisphosphate aldolase class-II
MEARCRIKHHVTRGQFDAVHAITVFNQQLAAVVLSRREKNSVAERSVRSPPRDIPRGPGSSSFILFWEAAKAGFDSIVFDLSALPFEENIRPTKQAVEESTYPQWLLANYTPAMT